MNSDKNFGWYAMNVFFNRVSKMASFLESEDIDYYVPMKTVELFKEGEKIYEKKQLVASLLFLKCSQQYFSTLKNRYGDSFYVYSDFETKQPKMIPDKEMNSFMLVTSVPDLGMELLPNYSGDYKIGDHVKVIDGVFKGAEGYVKRIQGRKRLIVAIEGIAIVATSYIPRSFLEILDN